MKDTSGLDELFSPAAPIAAFDLDKELRGRVLTLYGAGESSHWFVEIVMKRYGFCPHIVLDRRYAAPDEYEGIAARSPAGYEPSAQEKAGLVIVCTGMPDVFDAIKTHLQTMGYRHIRALMDIYEIHNPFKLPMAWREDAAAFFGDQRPAIEKAFVKLADAQSRDVFRAVLATHLHRKPVPVPRRPRAEQYFPADVPLARGYGSFVCCGAYKGDVIRELYSHHGKVSDVMCFESDPDVFRSLDDWVSGAGEEVADRITAWPYAVYDRSARLPYSETDGLGSRLDPQGARLVQTACLDDVLAGRSPTMITMDIEGAEPQALKGAEAILRRHTPDLAICVYHAIDHLWSVLHDLDSLDVGYRFYLRNYTGFCYETVLYATVP